VARCRSATDAGAAVGGRSFCASYFKDGLSDSVRRSCHEYDRSPGACVCQQRDKVGQATDRLRGGLSARDDPSSLSRASVNIDATGVRPHRAGSKPLEPGPVEGKLRWWRRRSGYALIETIVLSPSHGEQKIIEADYIILAAGSTAGL
jgi:hypothetical protein